MEKTQEQEYDTLYVCLMGAANTGKSTLMHGVMWLLKVLGFSVEVVSEYPKELVHEGRMYTLMNRPGYIYEKHLKKWSELKGKYRVVITDAPLLNSILYYNEEGEKATAIKKGIYLAHKEFRTMNIFLEMGDLPFESVGRYQSGREEVLAQSEEFKKKLDEMDIEYTILTSKKGVFESLMLLGRVVKMVSNELGMDKKGMFKDFLGNVSKMIEKEFKTEA